MASGDRLFRQVEAFPLSLGDHAGKTIGHIALHEPEALEAETRRKGTHGHAQRRLLRDYALAKKAQDQLRKSAQEAFALERGETEVVVEGDERPLGGKARCPKRRSSS